MLETHTVRTFGFTLTFTGLGTLASFGVGSAGVSLSLLFWGLFETMAWVES